MRCYLSSPLSGLSPTSSGTWKVGATERLLAAGWEVCDPLRGTEKLHAKGRKLIPRKYKGDEPSLSSKAFVSRDLQDVRRADVVLCYLLEADKVSIGCMFELAWSMLFPDVLTVIVINPRNIHQHPFVEEAGVIFPDLDGALDYIISSMPEVAEEEIAP